MSNFTEKLSTLHGIHLKLLVRVGFFSRLRHELEGDYERLYGAYGDEWELCLEYCKTFEETYREHAEDCKECYEVLRAIIANQSRDKSWTDTPDQNIEELFDTTILLSKKAREDADEGVRIIQKLCSSIQELEKEYPY